LVNSGRTYLNNGANNRTKATYLYTVTEDNRAKKLAVTTGKVIEGNVIIKEGLKSGMRIVTDGIENLSDGTPVQIKITRKY